MLLLPAAVTVVAGIAGEVAFAVVVVVVGFVGSGLGWRVWSQEVYICFPRWPVIVYVGDILVACSGEILSCDLGWVVQGVGGRPLLAKTGL